MFRSIRHCLLSGPAGPVLLPRYARAGIGDRDKAGRRRVYRSPRHRAGCRLLDGEAVKVYMQFTRGTAGSRSPFFYSLWSLEGVVGIFTAVLASAITADGT